MARRVLDLADVRFQVLQDPCQSESLLMPVKKQQRIADEEEIILHTFVFDNVRRGMLVTLRTFTEVQGVPLVLFA